MKGWFKMNYVLAERWRRLIAFMVDYLCVLLICFLFGIILLLAFPDFTISLFKDESASIRIYNYFIGVILFILYSYISFSNGQTWGKKLLKIKIVNQDGTDFSKKRYILIRVPLAFCIPIVSTLGFLMIFCKDRLCLHDRLAESIVVKA